MKNEMTDASFVKMGLEKSIESIKYFLQSQNINDAQKVFGALGWVLQAEKVLADLAESRGWRTIESAPRDGTPILLLIKGDGDMAVYRYHQGENGGLWAHNRISLYIQLDHATHWQPLPAPPQTPEEKI